MPSTRSEEHTSELQSQSNLVCRLLLEKKSRFLSPASIGTVITGCPLAVVKLTPNGSRSSQLCNRMGVSKSSLLCRKRNFAVDNETGCRRCWRVAMDGRNRYSAPSILARFFFNGHGAHRDLNSFPTRRSSD